MRWRPPDIRLYAWMQHPAGQARVRAATQPMAAVPARPPAPERLRVTQWLELYQAAQAGRHRRA